MYLGLIILYHTICFGSVDNPITALSRKITSSVVFRFLGKVSTAFIICITECYRGNYLETFLKIFLKNP